jgi:hypothetical protein
MVPRAWLFLASRNSLYESFCAPLERRVWALFRRLYYGRSTHEVQ